MGYRDEIWGWDMGMEYGDEMSIGMGMGMGMGMGYGDGVRRWVMGMKMGYGIWG